MAEKLGYIEFQQISGIFVYQFSLKTVIMQLL